MEKLLVIVILQTWLKSRERILTVCRIKKKLETVRVSSAFTITIEACKYTKIIIPFQK